MSSAELPDYDELAACLDAVEASLGPAEAQGVFCGQLCATGRPETARWLDDVLADAEADDTELDECHTLLTQLADHTLEKMNDTELGLQLLLPDDDAPLAERARELGSWCEGFLYGLGLGGLKEDQALPDNVREIIHDFGQIARVTRESDETGESEENALVEIVEFVRMGVLLVYEELQPVKRQQTIH